MASEANHQDALSSFRRALPDIIEAWPDRKTFQDLTATQRRSVERTIRQLHDLMASVAEAVQTAPPPLVASRVSSNEELDVVTPQMEAAVGVRLADLAALMTLDSVTGFGPQKFKALLDANIDAESALREPQWLPFSGKTGESLRHALSNVAVEDRNLAHRRAARQIVKAFENKAKVLTYTHPHYPVNVLASNNPVPILYARGDSSVLIEPKAVACVGSRDLREPYMWLQAEFARNAVARDFVVASGFATGADTVAHTAAVEAGGRTICVMPGGLDRPFPPENKAAFAAWKSKPGVVFISEFPFGTATNSMNLRKRNKTIVACARGVLVGQSSSKGGAMNAFRFGLEQRKPIATFHADQTVDTSGNLEIAHSQKGITTSFPLNDGGEEWNEWLSRLR